MTFLDTRTGMCETYTRPLGTLEKFRKADDKLQREGVKRGKGKDGKKGEQRKGKEGEGGGEQLEE